MVAFYKQVSVFKNIKGAPLKTACYVSYVRFSLFQSVQLMNGFDSCYTHVKSQQFAVWRGWNTVRKKVQSNLTLVPRRHKLCNCTLKGTTWLLKL